MDMVKDFNDNHQFSDQLLISIIPRPKTRLTLDSGFYDVVISILEPVAYGVVIQLLSDWIKHKYKERSIKKFMIGKDEIDTDTVEIEVITKIIIKNITVQDDKDDTQD